MPDHPFIKVFNDNFTQVRAADGTLLGVIPRIRDTDEAILGSNGAAYAIGVTAQACVLADPRDPMQDPKYLNGFIALDGVKLRNEPRPSATDGEDPDLAVGV